MMKACNKCLVDKEFSEFSKNKQKTDGLDIYCKSCKKEKRQKYLKPTIEEENLELNTKRCFNCKEIKQFSEFAKMKAKADGLNHNCNICKNVKQRLLHKNKELKEVKVESKVCITCNVDKPSCGFNGHKGMSDGLRSHCIECQSDYRKEYHEIIENKEKGHEQNKKFCDDHKNERNKIRSDRYCNDIQFNSRDVIGRRTRNFSRFESIDYNKEFGCTPKFFRKWLEFQFDDGMTFNNHGKSTKSVKKWELDHIIGYTNFDLTDEFQKSLCTHWTNIQPMWGHENKEKLDRTQLHHVMNSIVNIHRFIQHTNTNKDGYTNLGNRLKLLHKI
jgi:hypothetical protein